MDAQQEHDLEMSKRMDEGRLELSGSRERLEAALRAKNGSSMEPNPPKKRRKKSAPTLDPLAMAVNNHPGLTREEAAELAERFGF